MAIVLALTSRQYLVASSQPHEASGFDLQRVKTNMLKRFFHDARGQYLVQTVILFPLLMLLIGMVLDGGWMYWQYRRAEVAVNASAQAASHAIDIEYFRETDQIRLDAAEAAGVAYDFANLNRRGNVTLTGIQISPNLIVVNGTTTIPTIFLRLAGISSFTMRVQGTAYPAFGINQEGQ